MTDGMETSARIVAKRSEIGAQAVPEARFAAHVRRGPKGPELSQPLRLWQLHAAKP